MVGVDNLAPGNRFFSLLSLLHQAPTLEQENLMLKIDSVIDSNSSCVFLCSPGEKISFYFIIFYILLSTKIHL